MEPQVIETALHILLSISIVKQRKTLTFLFRRFATACGCTTYLPSVCHDFSGSLLSYQLDHTSSTPSTNFFCPVSRTRSTPAQHRSLALCSIRDIEGVAKLARHDRKGNPFFLDPRIPAAGRTGSPILREPSSLSSRCRPSLAAPQPFPTSERTAFYLNSVSKFHKPGLLDSACFDPPVPHGPLPVP